MIQVPNEMLSDAINTGRLLSKNARPQNVVYPGLLAASVAFIRHASILHSVACYLLILCVYAVAASLNNIADIRTDALNKRTDNPLVGESLKRPELTWFVLIALCGVIALQAWLAQPYSGIIVVADIALIYAYSDRRLNIQVRGIWGTVLLCALYSSLPLLLGAYQQPLGVQLKFFLVASWMALATVPVILAKDYKDYVGDKKTNKLTPLVRYGAVKVRLLAYATITVSFAAYLALSIVYRVQLLLSAVCVLTYILLTVLLHLRQGELSKVHKTALLFVLIAMSLMLIQSGKP